MSNIKKAIDDYIENKLWNLHTAFLAKVISVSGKEYKIKPLSRMKEYGRSATDSPIITGVRRMKPKLTVTTTSCEHPATYTVEDKIEAGDIVVCVAHERDLSNVLDGTEGTPLSGIRHNLNDAIIIGVMDL